jgi:hypothetical protein
VAAVAAVVALTVAAGGASRESATLRCSEQTVAKDALGNRIALSGTWLAEDGSYRLRQLGSCLYWVGNSRGSSAFFGNVFQTTANGTWVDVANGRTGRLTLTIDRGQRLLRRTGGAGAPYPASNWRRTTR